MEPADDPFDFSLYMDKVSSSRANVRLRNSRLNRPRQAPLTVRINSPLELVQQFFVKLGSRYVVVIDSNGFCKFGFSFSIDRRYGEGLSNDFADEGVIDKNGWLAFLGELETKAH